MDPFDLRQWPGFVQAGGDPSSPAITDQIAIDSRRIGTRASLFVALPGNFDDGHKFVASAGHAGARYALVQNSWKGDDEIPSHLTLLRVDDTLRAFQEIVRAYRRQLPTKVIGITGSYGKTMVKDMLLAIVGQTKSTAASPGSFNSQIGVPLSLLTIKKEHEIAFIEAGISKKNEMDILADIIFPECSILTHVGKKHMTTLGDLKTTASELSKMLVQTPKEHWVIVPHDPFLHPFLAGVKSNVYFWNEQAYELPHAKFLSTEHSAKMPYHVAFPDGNEFRAEVTSGFYYFLDLLNITLKAAWLLGIPSELICEGLRNYTPEPIRTEIWKSPSGAVFINDSYCSDPQSVDQALKYLDQTSDRSRKIFVFGGMRGKPKVTDYRRIAQAITRSDVHWLMLVGNHPYSPLIEEMNKQSPQTEISACANYHEAINHLRARIKQDDVVLLKGDKKEPLDSLTEAFNDSICNNQCIINLAAIRDNIATIRNRIAPRTRVMVIVKALAYGTDAVRMSKFLATCGIDILGVSYVDEGVVLKRAGVTQTIFVINAATYEAAKVVKWNLEVGVSDKTLIEALASEASRQNKVIKVHLHVDTGMSRFGCRPEEALALAKLVLDCPSLKLEGVMTHFASADNPHDDPFTNEQVRCFENVIAELKENSIEPTWIHASNSSGVTRFQFTQFNMVRIGLAVFGLYSSEASRKSLELRMALSLISRIVGINICKAGETISYGRSYRVNRDQQKIAVLPIGYFDGLHRNYSGKGHVIIRGFKAPMVGKICMDFMMVDVTDIPNVTVGDSVLIFGEDEYGHYLSPEDLANRGDSIVHELITCLGPRIQRIFVHEEAQMRKDEG
jgi:Alr-MurF fusion protein